MRLLFSMTFRVLLVGLFASSAHAELEVTNLWSRATVPAASTGAVYGRFHNAGEQPLVITALESSIAKKVEIHRSTSREGMMGMEHVPQVRLASGEELRLEPGGMHIMLMGLKKPLERGSTFEIRILSEDDTVTAKVAVGEIGQMEHPAH